MLEPGQIVRFFYLWKRQATEGEESGRRARPVCVVVRTAAAPRLCFSFPSRAGLDFPCWIILDEYNRVELDKASDFESTTPLGSFSPAFLKKIALAVKNAAAA